VEWRKDVAGKTGLGFALPPNVEILTGQLGQPEDKKIEVQNAA
jgi:hypothetical protein